MKTFIVLSLDARRPKKDLTCPILLRISHFGKISAITLGIYVKEADWDDNSRKIRASYKGSESVARLNNYLQKKKAEAIDLVAKLDDQKVLETLSVLDLKSLIEKKSDSQSFLAFGDALSKEFTEANRLGNARSYRCAVSVLRKFNKGQDLSFREVNYSLLTQFEQNHLKKGYALNGLAAYLRTIRAIYNEGIRRKMVDKELYPFDTYSIRTTKTRKRAISMESIRAIQTLEIDVKSHLYNARNFFMASFYMRGISYTDLAHLKVSDIVDGRIFYDRQKTDKPYDIKITPELQKILDLYLPGKAKSDFIFPIITHKELKEQYDEIQAKRKRFNANLRRIAKLCGISANLTSYVSRHSFATRAKNLGVPIAAISDMLGHSDTKTTEVYLSSLSSDAMDNYHKKIIE